MYVWKNVSADEKKTNVEVYQTD